MKHVTVYSLHQPPLIIISTINFKIDYKWDAFRIFKFKRLILKCHFKSAYVYFIKKHLVNIDSIDSVFFFFFLLDNA